MVESGTYGTWKQGEGSEKTGNEGASYCWWPRGHNLSRALVRESDMTGRSVSRMEFSTCPYSTDDLVVGRKNRMINRPETTQGYLV